MALAVLSKPSAVMLPVLGFTLALLITPSKRARWAIRAILAVLFVSVPAILVTSGAQPIPEENFVAPLWARPLVALDGLAFYLYKTGFPVGLTLSYGRTPRSVLFTHSWAYWTWILPVVLLLALGLALRRNGPWSALAPVSSIGFGFFCLGFFPVLGLVPFHYQTWSTVSDRYAYLSLLGPSLIVAFVMSRAAEMKWPRLAVGVLPLLIIGLGAMSYTQAGYWHDTLTVARRMLEVAPDNEMSQSTAGEAQTAAGELDEAADHLERSLRLSEPSEIPNYIFELGLVRHLQGRISEAAELYKRAISRRPSVAGAQNNLGVILLMGGQSAEAALYFEAAIQFDPLRSAEPYFNLARATEQLPGQAEKARALFQRAIQLQPGIEENETSLLWRLRGHKPREIGFNTELRLMWPYGYPVPGSREGY